MCMKDFVYLVQRSNVMFKTDKKDTEISLVCGIYYRLLIGNHGCYGSGRKINVSYLHSAPTKIILFLTGIQTKL